jgi:hypothetical protein
MADFCWDCVQELGVEAVRNDLNHTASNPLRRGILSERRERLLAICEGCGPGTFDPEGHRLDEAQERQPGGDAS